MADGRIKQEEMIETERLLLRKYTMDDFEALYEIMSDAETMQHYPVPFDEARTRRWIEWNIDNYSKYGFGLWAVVLKENGEFIGDCGITIQNIDGKPLPEIGYHINKKYWRRGFAKEAAQAVRDWAFENTDYPSLYSYCKYTNEASYRTAEAIGMHFEKEYPDEANMITHVSVIHRVATRQKLASVAKTMAQVPFHGFADGEKANLEPIVQPFPKWTVEEADRLWCAAFVYYCCRQAGFEIPIRPEECKSCHLAGCIAWEEFATGDPRIEYHTPEDIFLPESGDIVLYDRVFDDHEHDHIGIIVEKRENTILAAEGNIDNRSGIIERPVDEHIRAYIRIPDGYRYSGQR
ncbi:MAG: GNAT family N-acetyltransferase [Lachnospiraceae bacterium]|nr:GNAT family N-acetyltransferase [Lachnospiraceae bacterium]